MLSNLRSTWNRTKGWRWLIFIPIAILLGGFIYDKVPRLFAFVGLDSLHRKTERIRELFAEIERIESENLETIGNLRRGTAALTRELAESLDRERETAESLDREREEHREMVEALARSGEATTIIRREAQKIYGIAREIEERVRELPEGSGGKD